MKYIISYSVRAGKPTTEEITKLTGEVIPKYKCRWINLSNAITNPYRIKALRKLNGKHPAVQEFLLRCKRTVQWILPQNNHYLQSTYYEVLCFGCTGGKHRSVAIAEMAAANLKAVGKEVTVIHRDLKEA